MGLSIRRGATKQFMLTIPPYCDSPDGSVEAYSNLPAYLPESDIGVVYKVSLASDDYPEKSYFEWNGQSWDYVNSDTTWKSLGTVNIRITQQSATIDKVIENWPEDILTVNYTQEETLRLAPNKTAKLQILCVKGNLSEESTLISEIYQIAVFDSLWDEAVHNE